VFRKNRNRASVPRPSQMSGRRMEPSQSQWTASTRPVAMLPNGTRVVFNVHYQDSSHHGLTFDWNPSADPESLVDVAIDELSFALDFQQDLYESAGQFQHDFVGGLGGVRWQPPLGRDRTEPSLRILREFGDSVEVTHSIWGALRQGLRSFSLHLTDAHLYILSEGRDDYQHRVPLTHVLDVQVPSKHEWRIVEWTPNAAEQQETPSEEKSTHSDIRFIGFFKLNRDPGWVRFSEDVLLAVAQRVPSLRRRLQLENKPPVDFIFIQTAKGPRSFPSRFEDLEVYRSHYLGKSEIAVWLQEGKESLSPWESA